MASIRSTTTDNLLSAPGASIEVGGNPVGALGEGESVVFSLEMEIEERSPMGAKGPLKGGTRIVKAVPVMTFTLSEFTAANMGLAFSGLGNSSAAASMAYGSSGAIGTYADGDYKTIVVSSMSTGGSKAYEVHMLDALMTTPPEMSFGDGPVTYQLVYRGHYDDANPEVPPFYVIIEI